MKWTCKNKDRNNCLIKKVLVMIHLVRTDNIFFNSAGFALNVILVLIVHQRKTYCKWASSILKKSGIFKILNVLTCISHHFNPRIKPQFKYRHIKNTLVPYKESWIHSYSKIISAKMNSHSLCGPVFLLKISE